MARPATDAAALPPAAITEPKFIVPLGRGSRGTSWWARWAVERGQSQGRAVVVAYADRPTPPLSNYFEGVTAPPSADDRDVREWLAAFVEAQIEQRFTALLDLGGGDLILKRIAREMSLVDFLGQHGIRPIAVHLLGPDADDLAYLRDVETDNLFAPEATVLIFNEALVPSHRTPRAAAPHPPRPPPRTRPRARAPPASSGCRVWNPPRTSIPGA